jgi:hypothetical protein
MKRKVLGTMGVVAFALGVIGPASASANNGVGDCHADQLQFFKQGAGTNSGEATADVFGVTGQFGQEFISQQCGQS